MPLMSDPAGRQPIPQSERPHPTADEIRERINFCRDCLARQMYKSTIKAELQKQFGPLSPRTIEHYLARARARVESDRARGRDLMRNDCKETLDWVIRHATEPRDVTAAVKAKAELYGVVIKIGPAEMVAEALGITVDEFYRTVGAITGRNVPDPPTIVGDGAEPHEV